MLCQLRNYIKKCRTASMTQIAREFHTDSKALEPMLDIWVAKGVVSIHHHPLACAKSCNKCDVNDNTYYCWIG